MFSWLSKQNCSSTFSEAQRDVFNLLLFSNHWSDGKNKEHPVLKVKLLKSAHVGLNSLIDYRSISIMDRFSLLDQSEQLSLSVSPSDGDSAQVSVFYLCRLIGSQLTGHSR